MESKMQGFVLKTYRNSGFNKTDEFYLVIWPQQGAGPVCNEQEVLGYSRNNVPADH